MTEKHAGGRPRKYETVDEMDKAIETYFETAIVGEYTITGLALSLGFTSRLALLNYEGYSEEFFYAIKRAKLRIENDYETSLRKHGRAGEIFGLKNFDWSDKREVAHSGEMTVHFDKEDEGL